LNKKYINGLRERKGENAKKRRPTAKIFRECKATMERVSFWVKGTG